MRKKRVVRIHNIRQEMKALKSQYKVAGQEERTGLAQLMCILQKTIRVLRQAEWHQRWRRERARKRAAFITNPFKFTKDLLGQKRSGKLASSQKDIDQHLKQLYSDPAREQEFGESNNLIELPEPDVQFVGAAVDGSQGIGRLSAKQGQALLQDRVALHTKCIRTVPNSCYVLRTSRAV